MYLCLFYKQGNQCMLQSEREVGLTHLLGKWISGPALQRAMLNAGVNIFVNEHTDKYVSSCSKVCISYLLDCRIEGGQAKFGLICLFMLYCMNKPVLHHHVSVQNILEVEDKIYFPLTIIYENISSSWWHKTILAFMLQFILHNCSDQLF